MDQIFRRTKLPKFSDGDENFVWRKILSDIVLSNKVCFFNFDFLFILKHKMLLWTGEVKHEGG